MKKASAPAILVATVLLAVALTVQAQEPKKVYRWGIYHRPMQLLTPPAPREFG